MLFLVLGPLAIPMLWRSRRFSVVWKSVLTALVLVLTVVLLWQIWATMKLILSPLDQLEKINGY